MGPVVERKFIESYDINNFEIYADYCWKDVIQVHKTVEYEVYELKLKSGLSLKCADNHIVFFEGNRQTFVKDLKPGDEILTENDLDEVVFVKNTQRKENMYDVSVDSENHSYFTNGILSHNSTSYSIFCLWYILTNRDKNILICANKLKTAIEILSRIQLAYQELPNWLKPGITEWNKMTMAFDNGCKISAEATSGNSGRGLSVNCISGNEKITILKNEKIENISLKKAYKLYKFGNKLSNEKILTDTGWSNFLGIIKYPKKKTNLYLVENKKIRCTSDHFIFDRVTNNFKKAERFKCLNEEKIEDVYDIVNVEKNNRFIVNDKLLVHNCLVCDEFAFLQPGIEEEFLKGVFPVVSSSKTSKIIIVSTANGMGNEFYRIYTRASLDLDNTVKDKALKWTPIRIDWTDVPGRDEAWKQQQIETFGGDVQKFAQEYRAMIF